MKFVIYVFTLTLLISCRKETPEELEAFIGDYHLIYIKYSETEFWTPDEIEYEVGLKILENSTLETYVDGKIFKKHTFDEVVSNTEEKIIVRYRKNLNKNILVYIHKNGVIETEDFPFPKKSNFFKK